MKQAEKDFYSGPVQLTAKDWEKAQRYLMAAPGKIAKGLYRSFTNKGFQAGLLASLTAGLTPVAYALSLPGAVAATATGITNPTTAQALGDFVTGFFDKGPAPIIAERAIRRSCSQRN